MLARPLVDSRAVNGGDCVQALCGDLPLRPPIGPSLPHQGSFTLAPNDSSLRDGAVGPWIGSGGR